MKTFSRELRRKQLDRVFESLAKKIQTPKKGWVREIREALGMSMEDLGRRMGVIKQRVEKLEKSELEGKVTLESLQIAADALGCDFVYFFRPRLTLQDAVEKQALKAAQMEVLRMQRSMSLEEQKLTNQKLKELVKETAGEMLASQDRRIWKER